MVLALHVATGVSLLTHWALNSDICCLTLLEAWLTGSQVEHGFLYSLIAPLYRPSAGPTRDFAVMCTILLTAASACHLAVRLKKSHIRSYWTCRLKSMVLEDEVFSGSGSGSGGAFRELR